MSRTAGGEYTSYSFEVSKLLDCTVALLSVNTTVDSEAAHVKRTPSIHRVTINSFPG